MEWLGCVATAFRFVADRVLEMRRTWVKDPGNGELAAALIRSRLWFSRDKDYIFRVWDGSTEQTKHYLVFAAYEDWLRSQGLEIRADHIAERLAMESIRRANSGEDDPSLSLEDAISLLDDDFSDLLPPGPNRWQKFLAWIRCSKQPTEQATDDQAHSRTDEQHEEAEKAEE